MVKYFGEIAGVQNYFDDILIYSDSKSEHDSILERVAENARKFNVKFNLKNFNTVLVRSNF